MMNRSKTTRLQWFAFSVLTIIAGSFDAHAESKFTVTFDSAHTVSESLPLIAAPVNFNVVLVDESTVEFSWNPELLNGDAVDYFNVWDRDQLLTQTNESRWQLSGIDRNETYDFSVSAVTVHGTQTRRTSRVYFDLPQLDLNLPDANNDYLPPLESLKAEIIDEDSVRISWLPAKPYWSWAEPSAYSYDVTVGGTLVANVEQNEYVYRGLVGLGPVWIGISAVVKGQLSSRQPNLVLVDTSNEPGTVSSGFPGFNSLFGLHSAVYSSTAIELFWQASQFPNVSHVYINGELIARMNYGYSLFIEDIPPGERLLLSVGQGWPYDVDAPYDWPLLHDYPLMHTWIDMPPGVQDNPDNPSAVTGLRADVYSSSAAEVFWDRSDVVPARYRVYLNGQFLHETDGVSWYLDNLDSGFYYTVGITMLGQDGYETDIVETTFETTGQSVSVPIVCRIEGLAASVYSATAAEVFWNRKSTAQRYTIYLDDIFLGDTDAVSWFYDDFEPGSAHQLAISVADDACTNQKYSVTLRLNPTASVSINSPGNSPGIDSESIINRQNHVQLIDEILKIYVGDYYTKSLDFISDFNISGQNPDGTLVGAFDCESGFFEQVVNPSSTNAGVFFLFDFGQCLIDGTVHNGYVSGQDGARGVNYHTDQYSVWQNSDNHIEYSGYVQKWISQSAFFDRIHSFDTTDFSLEASSDNINLILEHMTTSFAYGSLSSGLDKAWMRGGFATRLELANNTSLTVGIPVDFYYALNTRTDGREIEGVQPSPTPVSAESRNNWTFSEGQLELTAEDSSTLLLDANNGNPESVSITIQSGTGIEVFEQPWSLWADALRFEHYPDLTR